ncbi:MAG: 4-hydroxy-tetrahydrodipicolinate reductase [Candidatus Omnitrophica bacterium]|nr:4-hydroxy-tetrahydrodipicolinate reductase [Candidatus Omnitrophota bacterium]
MINVVLSGACGKMSGRIAAMMAGEKNIRIAAAIEKKGHSGVGKKFSDVAGIDSNIVACGITDDLKKIINNIDVIVEFTTPKSTLEHLQEAVRFKKAIVIGTTGFNRIEVEKINNASQKIPVFFSPNTSIGVNLVFDILDKIGRALPLNYNVEIVETHHKFKKDAPSGTAKKMAEIIASSRKQNADKVVIYGRKGRTEERPENQICIHALRAGGVKGKHEVRFVSEEDEIVITHSAFSRDIFAKGAVQAVKFIVKKNKGLYSTADLI